jgi:hypothetical protein
MGNDQLEILDSRNEQTGFGHQKLNLFTCFTRGLSLLKLVLLIFTVASRCWRLSVLILNLKISYKEQKCENFNQFDQLLGNVKVWNPVAF